MTEDWKNGGFGLYVHWPFCEAKCPYCDFNSHVSRNIEHEVWQQSYRQELKRVAEETSGRLLNSIYFGGGTPSLMQPRAVEAIISDALSYWTPANNLEITLEANPSSIEFKKFSSFREAGVNRVSMGMQAMSDHDLKRLGRIHTVSEALTALDVARSTFDRVNFDLIYARQDQSLQDWEKELNFALSLGSDHMSLYQLTIESGTAFGDRYKAGRLKGLPQEDLAADMYDLTQEICAGHDMNRYEVSNHALPGCESRHNLIYWHYGDYIGIGPGAHGRVTIGGTRYATETYRAPVDWLNRVKTGSGENPRTCLSLSEQADEYLIMGLRVHDGIDVERYAALNGKSMDADTLEHLESLDLIHLSGSRLIVTNQGVKVLNALIAEISSAS